MSRRLISSGSTFEAVAGYSRAVVDGRIPEVYEAERMDEDRRL